MKVLALLFTCIFAAALLASPPEEGLQPFSHAMHVADDWWDIDGRGNGIERAMDCRGCHAAGGTDPLRAGSKPTDLCSACHIEGVREYEGTPLLRDSGDRGQRFAHNEHTRLDCAKCHSPSLDPGITGRQLAVPIAKGIDYCARCHGPDSTEGYDVPWDKLRKPLNARLAEHPSMDMAEFSHANHIAGFGQPGATNWSDCQTCHAVESLTGAELLPEVNTETCSIKCHSGATFIRTEALVPSPLRGTFRHSTHLSSTGAGLNCGDCHVADSTTGLFTLSRDMTTGQAMCASCHDSEQAAGRAPSVQRHDQALFGECAKCHLAGGSAHTTWQAFNDRKRVIPLLERLRTAYALPPRDHSNWLKGSTKQACTECHKGSSIEPGALPRSEPFRHGSHLPQGDPKLAGQLCIDCHVGQAPAPADKAAGAIGIQDLAVATSAAACMTCHKGEPLSTDPAPRPRVQSKFAHSSHTAVACIDCHGNGVTPASDVAVHKGIADCTKCHGHDQAKVQVPHHDAFAASDAADCRRCHTAGFPGTQAVELLTRSLGAAPGRVPHNPNDLDCASCHMRLRETAEPSAASTLTGAAPRYRAERLSTMLSRAAFHDGKPLRNPHDSKPPLLAARAAALRSLDVTPEENPDRYFFELGRRSFRGKGAPYKNNGTYCLHCHWNSISHPENQQQYTIDKEALNSLTFSEDGSQSLPWRVGLPGIKALIDSK